LFYSDQLIESGRPIKVKADLCGAKSPLVAMKFMQMHRQIQASDFAKIYQRIATGCTKRRSHFLAVGGAPQESKSGPISPL
jgi:hypothetical protein